ncbi:MAG: hypothetical protein H0X41_01580 [Chitinophagaceae bacterium]|nr:hypothetical protein [Chitinophagaceae bacterium]
MSDKAKYNPFGNPDGTPEPGKEAEFFQYARDHSSENRNEIPPSDAELIVDVEKALGEQMDSDPEKR